MTVAWLVFAAAVAGGGWYVHVRVYPLKHCPRCNRSGRNPGGGSTYRRCGRCGGKGEVRRWGAPRIER